MSNTGYNINGVKLNGLTTLLAIPLFAISILPFAIAFGWQFTINEIRFYLDAKFVLILLFGVILHEGIHALTWLIVLRRGFKIIKFGFNFHSLSPYTHCKIPMKVWQYRLSGLMPGLIMGIFPVILSFVIQSPILNFVGFLFLWAAGGDFISLFLLRKLKKNSIIKDHPDEMGFIIEDEG